MAKKPPNEGSFKLHISDDLLSAYIDGMASREERARVEVHLADCQVCSQNLLAQRQVVALLHDLPRIPLPRAFTLSEEQVGIRQTRARLPWIVTYLRAATVMAAIMLVVLAGGEFLLLSSSPQSAQPGSVALRSGEPAPLSVPAGEEAVEEPAQAIENDVPMVAAAPAVEGSQPGVTPMALQVEPSPVPASEEPVGSDSTEAAETLRVSPEGLGSEPVEEPMPAGGGGTPSEDGEPRTMTESTGPMFSLLPEEVGAPKAAPAARQTEGESAAESPQIFEEEPEVPSVAAAESQAFTAIPQEYAAEPPALEGPLPTPTVSDIALIPQPSPTEPPTPTAAPSLTPPPDTSLPPAPTLETTPMPAVGEPVLEGNPSSEAGEVGDEVSADQGLLQWLRRWQGPLRVAEVALGALVVLLIATTWVAGRKV